MSDPSPPGAWFEDLRLAIAFSTRLPLGRPGGRPGDRPERVRRALRLAPLAGLLVALFVAGVLVVLESLSLPPLAAALIAVAAGFWLTGGLHEDGLADTADGLGAVAPRAGRLAIMRDSRVGTFGAVALILSFGLRALALAQFDTGPAALAALVAAHGLSRGLFLPTMVLMAPARTDGLSGGLPAPHRGDALVALTVGMALTLAALGFSGALAAAIAALIACGAFLLVARARLGGYTGDVLGAVQQVGEITMLLTIASTA
jgi:adenosylcobinamide-GDP ribazoletransferase